MMGIEYIQAQADDDGVVARRKKLEPKIVADTPSLEEDLRHIPNLGDYVPKHWKLVATHFVDSSGFGEEDEAAITFDQFKTRVQNEIASNKEIFGWGLVQQGQFQVYIGQFETTR